MKIAIAFSYYTGIRTDAIPNVARVFLRGTWDQDGRLSNEWTSSEMVASKGEDGGLKYTASVDLDSAGIGQSFRWGVAFVLQDGQEIWAISTEVRDRDSRERYRSFQFTGPNQHERYYLTHCRRLGANKVYPAGADPDDPSVIPSIRFAVWAPNARNVEVVMGSLWDSKDVTRTPTDQQLPVADIAGGYAADESKGIRLDRGPFQMHAQADGVWETDPDDPALRDFSGNFDHKPYMFRVTKNDGSVAYRTDLYSRCQVGFGAFNPGGAEFRGLIGDLDGTQSCSVVVDPERVTKYFRERGPDPVRAPFAPVWPERHFIDARDFWADEFTDKVVPKRVEDLIIYELHVGALGFGDPRPGSLEAAIALLDHIEGVGANAVELLPMSEFGGGGENWGYATSHYFAIEFAGGGRDQYKFFIKECHRRGIAVILDVVYNHFAHSAERAEYHYDSNWPDYDIYYWYEGTPFQYAQPDGGYVDNMSTAYAPRYHEEMVRKMFISSAVALILEFHIDGFRVDQTTSIHSYNRLHADGRVVPDANIFGAKLLREFSRTLRLFNPGLMLMAEDHSDWDQVTLPLEQGGMGFDARWYADYYHHLAGDTERGSDCAKLIYTAAMQPNGPLAMDYFAGALGASGHQRVVYSESHDEAGNSGGPIYDPLWTDPGKQHTSHRTIVVAVNGAPLVGNTRKYAEARCRFAWGVTVLSAGTPMFLFGEEVGATRRFKYNRVLSNKEDLIGMANGNGNSLYRFYSAINRLRLNSTAIRSRNIEIIYVHNANRILAFRRWLENEDILVVTSLNDRPFQNGYTLQSERLPDALWREVFNSDATEFGGEGIGNFGATLRSGGGTLNCIIPFNGIVVFRRES